MFHKWTVSRPAQEIRRCAAEECRAGEANVWTMCKEWATIYLEIFLFKNWWKRIKWLEINAILKNNNFAEKVVIVDVP